jgi:hypothetical protein
MERDWSFVIRDSKKQGVAPAACLSESRITNHESR